MGWGSSWDKPPIKEMEEEAKKIAEEAIQHGQGFSKDGKHVPLNEVYEEAAPVTERAWNNLKPTHDPYTNPGAYLYYECECGNKLDPRTKRFAELNNKASEAGWKIRWGSLSYVPYCPKCVEKKGIE